MMSRVNRYLLTGLAREPDGRAAWHVFRVCVPVAWVTTDITWARFIVEGAAGVGGLIIYSDKDVRPRYWPIKNPHYGRARSLLPPPLLPRPSFYIIAFLFFVAGSIGCRVMGIVS